MKPTMTLVSLLTLAMAGCGPAPAPAPVPAPPPTPAPAKGGVAVIDLEAAAKRLGRDVAILAELKEFGAPLRDQLAASQKEYQEQIDRLKSSLGPKSSEADKQKAAETSRALNQQFLQKQQQAQQEINVKRASLVNRFRDEVKPVALKIAVGKGLGIVQIKSEITVLANEPDLEITDEVVAEMQRAPNPPPSPSPGTNP